MYKMIELNYNYNDLEPYIDAKTVEIHYGKHHQNYLNKTNAMLESNNYSENFKLEELYNKQIAWIRRNFEIKQIGDLT